VEFIGELPTTCAETVPGPSLVNENVRAEPEPRSGSNIRLVKVIVAVGDVGLGPDGLGGRRLGLWLGVAEESGAVEGELLARTDVEAEGTAGGLANAT
jgi:hypothetical protein